MKTLVILPTYNERENIRAVVEQILGLGLGLHALVVDDNSPDGTGDVADQLAGEHPEVQVMHRMTDRGRGLAGVAGFQFALDHGYDLAFEMDGDLSHSPAHIPAMLEAAESHDVVIGSRYVAGGGEEGRGWTRRSITRFAWRYMRFMLGVEHVMDCTSGFRCFTRSALETIDLGTLTSTGPSIVTEILARCRGMTIEEVPIQFVDRVYGQSKFGFKAIRDSFYVPFKIRVRRLFARR